MSINNTDLDTVINELYQKMTPCLTKKQEDYLIEQDVDMIGLTCPKEFSEEIYVDTTAAIVNRSSEISYLGELGESFVLDVALGIVSKVVHGTYDGPTDLRIPFLNEAIKEAEFDSARAAKIGRNIAESTPPKMDNRYKATKEELMNYVRDQIGCTLDPEQTTKFADSLLRILSTDTVIPSSDMPSSQFSVERTRYLKPLMHVGNNVYAATRENNYDILKNENGTTRPAIVRRFDDILDLIDQNITQQHAFGAIYHHNLPFLGTCYAMLKRNDLITPGRQQRAEKALQKGVAYLINAHVSEGIELVDDVQREFMVEAIKYSAETSE
jgi:hypothetical protein